ncbi:hypothetical protein LTR86_000541 [Recurvomyces mirabilis]|nr:hypothetical protein LTR86_000541 [Recurvomyces mirabilis]
MSILQTAALVGSLVATVAAHGRVTGAVIGGTYFAGYDPSSVYSQSPPSTIGWAANNLDNGFVAPDAYGSPDIICHKNATVGKISAPVAAGQNVTLQWSTWPSSHHGPVINYLAKVGGDFASVDKTALEWVKFDASGLLDDSAVPGTWASDELIANNNSWTLTIPSSIAPGNYVLRHEIIALHSAGNSDGAQNYPQCINLAITGSGSAAPSGTLGEKLYSQTDPGILISIYSAIASYIIPGPALWTGGSTGSAPASSAASSKPATSAASSAPASSAPASSAPASSVPALSTASSTSAVSTKAVVTTSSSVVVAPTSAAGSGCTQTITRTRSTSAASSSIVAPVSNVLSTSTSASSSVVAPVSASSSVVPPTHAISSYGSGASSTAATSSYLPPIATIVSNLPSSVLTKTISSTAIPTPTGGATTLPMPSKPLPPGWTLEDLLQWVDYLVHQAEESS